MLYISDLDGTLLRSNAILSPFAAQSLTNLIGQGLSFSIATARSIVSVGPIMEAVPLQLPIVCANGAYLADLKTGKRSDLQLLRGDVSQSLMALVRKYDMHVFAVRYEEEANREWVYLEKDCDNPLMRQHFNAERRARDSRLTEISEVENILSSPLLNINVMAPMKQMLRFREAMEDLMGDQLMGYLYEAEGVDGWYWMSVFHEGATKGKAIRRLSAYLGYDVEDVVVFGDQINDFSMFEMAGTAVAMGNAHDQLKHLATEVIGTNEEDSVVKYIFSQLSGA